MNRRVRSPALMIEAWQRLSGGSGVLELPKESDAFVEGRDQMVPTPDALQALGGTVADEQRRKRDVQSLGGGVVS